MRRTTHNMLPLHALAACILLALAQRRLWAIAAALSICD